jgi:hypothetical protein
VSITIHAGERLGPVRQLQGVNLGPRDFYWGLDFTEAFRQAGVPSVRLHDAPLQMGDVVDLHCIFPHTKADPDDPANYYFAMTDDYLASVRESGAEIYFRLGESIEHQPTKRYVNPSEWTPEAMARVCANIVRHYNAGWADGFEWDIEYWEFWNEPDGAWALPPERRACWTAGTEVFLDFYRAVGPAVKAADPSVKLGLAGFTNAIRDWVEAADPEDREVWGGWGTVLTRVAREGLPADFVSWHIYPSHWSQAEDLAAKVRQRLDEIGLAGAESHLTEWNYNPVVQFEGEEFNFMRARRSMDWRKYELAFSAANGPGGAALLFGTLARLQDSSVDLTHIYTGISQSFGLFAGTGRPHAKYYGVEAFAELSRAGERVGVEVDDPDALAALAVAGESGAQVGVAYLGDAPRDVALRVDGGPPLSKARWITDAGWVDLDIAAGDAGVATVTLPGPGVVVASTG